ncbi:MAG: hypothetical protein IKI64_07275 [Clostridia bacterium]|nr:hypothetical protein [Clostridia bacterium]
MDLVVTAKELNGSITPPPFKSEVLRALILNGLCGMRPDVLLDPSYEYCDDILNASKAVEAAFFSDASFETPIPVGESAALIRMLAPVLLFLRGKAEFSCAPSLMRRSMLELRDSLECSVRHDAGSGTIIFSDCRHKGSDFTVSAANSSQFASGMLIAAAVLGARVRIDSAVSVPYIDLTLRCLSRFGVSFRTDPDGYFRASGRLSGNTCFSFQPDMSYAANFTAAEFVTGGASRVAVIGSELGRAQPDADAREFFSKNAPDVSNCPDLFPILCVCALKKREDTVIIGTARLGDKESDRVTSVKALTEALGGSMDVRSNSVVVHGCGGRLTGGTVQSFGDHRIVMAASIASMMCSEPVVISGAQAVSKSAPCFFNDFRKLGGIAYEYDRE